MYDERSWLLRQKPTMNAREAAGSGSACVRAITRQGSRSVAQVLQAFSMNNITSVVRVMLRRFLRAADGDKSLFFRDFTACEAPRYGL
jgi:formylglycine-generating enzyme required for sulfatase activity